MTVPSSAPTTPDRPRRPFLDARWTRRRMVGLLILLTVFPGVFAGGIYSLTNIYPLSVRPMKRTPADLGMPFDSIELRSPDGKRLEGWYIPPISEPAPAIGVCHGHLGRMDQFLEQAKMLHDAGYGVGMVNLRHHGGSDRGIITFGVREGGDFLALVEALRNRDEHAGRPIGAIGFSMGAVTVLKAASLDDRIAAVVADSPFHDLSDEAYHRVTLVAGPWLAPYFWGFVMSYGCLLTGNTPSEWNVMSWMDSLQARPVFLLHGLSDNNIPAESSRRLKTRLPGAEVWYVEGSGHIQAREERAEEFSRRVVGFFDRHLKGPVVD